MAGSLRPTLATFPDLLAGALADLDAVRLLYHPQIGAQYGGAKRTVLEQCSTRMLPVLCGLYGPPVSHAQTDIEIGPKSGAAGPRSTLHLGSPMAASILGRRAESDLELAERQSDLEVGYEHMWVRFRRSGRSRRG